MTPEKYKELSIKEFTQAAKVYDSGHAGIYEMCKDDYPSILAELEKEKFHDVLDCGCGTGPMIQLLHDKYDLFANKKLIDKIKKIYVIICVVFAAAACLMVIICTAVQRGPLAITDDWGSGRGYIWKNLLDGFKNLPFINKIFGAGEASTAWVLICL